MNDEAYMQLALQLAKAVSGQTAPNPPVGAVIVNQGAIAGFGAHLKAGEAHAEVHAIAMAGDKTEGATMYVTLEPCSHHGTTPPCADLIIDKGISRAVIAMKDPNAKVAGSGIAKLEAAGITVEWGVMRAEAEAVNKYFTHYIQTSMPFVTVKAAVSLDGKTAAHTGDSKWVTGDASRRDVHAYRSHHEAILTGVNSVIADNPRLTSRIPGGRNPLRVILDHHLRTPPDAHVASDGQAETWIFTERTITSAQLAPFKEKHHVQIIQLSSLDITAVLRYLGEQKIMSLFVEGGATVNSSFLECGCIHQYVQYIAPKLIGGQNAPTAIAGKGFDSMKETLPLEVVAAETIGEDIKIVAEPRKDDAHVHRHY